MAARPIKTLASVLLSRSYPYPWRRLHLPNLAPFSSAAASPDAGDDRPAELPAGKLSRESVIYGIKMLDKTPGKALDLFRWVQGRSPAQLGETAYALMLRILARKDWVKDFWVLVHEMTDKGIELDNEMFMVFASSLTKEKLADDAKALRELFARLKKAREMNSTFNDAIEVIMGSEWSGEVEKRLDEIAFSVTDEMCLRMLRELEPVKAMAFCRWAARSGSGYKHNSTTYNAMGRILAKNGMVAEFWEFVKEMKTEGFDIDFDTYQKIYRTFHKNKMVKEALELYEMMMAGPYKPAEENCVEVLRNFSIGDDVDLELVSRLIKAHQACGYPMTRLIYNRIHCALTGMGRFEEGEKIAQNMRDAGYEPDNITYRQLVFGLCKFGKLEDACRVLDDMEKLGCPPDVKTWTILIQGHFSLGTVEQVLVCYGKMIEKKCEADADLLHVLFKGLLDKNKLDEAYSIVTELANGSKVKPLQPTFCLWIESLLGARKFEEALTTLKLMKTHGYPPHTNAFVDYISKYGTVLDAVEYLKVMTLKKHPSLTSYLRVFKAYFKEERHFEAQDLLNKCPHHIRNDKEVFKVFAEAKTYNPTADKEGQNLQIAP